MLDKYSRIDSRILRESVKDMSCQLNTPYCDGGGCVACHSNESDHGKGTSIKADDIFIAAGCASCHAVVDGREGKMDKHEREWYLRRGILRTIRTWFITGAVTISRGGR